MVLFIDHDAKAFLGIENDRSSTFGFAQLVADELTFHQELPIEVPEFRDVDILGIGREWERIDRASNRSSDRDAIFVSAFAHERELSKVSCESNSAAHDDVRFGAVATHPFAGFLR